MKITFIFPKNYSLLEIFSDGFKHLGWETSNIDFTDFSVNYNNNKQRIITKLPYSLKYKFQNAELKRINFKYIELIKEQKPDLILVYNEQKLLKETIIEFKKFSKVAFFLGDNPLYIQNRPNNLATIAEGDHIFSPDTFWIEQFKLMGINQTSFLITSCNNTLNYIKEVSVKEKEKYKSDVVFVGRQYHDTWGYKRALFYNNFTDFDFKIYGDWVWEKWFEYFPDLQKKFILNNNYLSFETVNTILNCSKIYPIDANPGLINGLHIRIFDCIGSGILPIIEYRKDVEFVFKGIDIPVIKDYRESKEIVNYYLENENKRKEIVAKLINHIDANYNSEITAKYIIANTIK